MYKYCTIVVLLVYIQSFQFFFTVKMILFNSTFENNDTALAGLHFAVHLPTEYHRSGFVFLDMERRRKRGFRGVGQEFQPCRQAVENRYISHSLPTRVLEPNRKLNGFAR